MARITREMHDTCNALFRQIKARDPELSARAMDRRAILLDGTPEQALCRDLCALSDTASSFATGIAPSRKTLKRVEAIITREMAS